MAKVKNYNLNVTEVRDSDFKNAFPGIFNFTVGILVIKYESKRMKLFLCMISSSNKRAHIRLKQPWQLLRSLRSTYSVVYKDDGPRQPINAYSAQPLLKWIPTWLVQVSNHHDRLPKAKIKVQFLHYPKHIINRRKLAPNEQNRILRVFF